VATAVPPGFSLRKPVSALAVSPELDDHRALRAIFLHSTWGLRGVASVSQAMRWLERNPVPVVICRRHLPDGDWHRLVRETKMLPRPPRILVCAPSPDDQLWEEVGAGGGYDVLAIPFDDRDVCFAVHMAWESWRRQWGTPPHLRPACAAAEGGPPAA
jgi:DNA-binding NtrC family response regulator